MRKLDPVWVIVTGLMALLMIMSYVILYPSGSGGESDDTNVPSWSRSNTETTSSELKQALSLLYEEHFNVNASFVAPILFYKKNNAEKSSSNPAERPESWDGLKSITKDCAVEAVTTAVSFNTESHTHPFEINFKTGEVDPSRLYKNFVLYLGSVSVFRPRALLALRTNASTKENTAGTAATANPVGRTGLHILVAYSQASLELLRFQTLCVFPTADAARAFEAGLLQKANTTAYADDKGCGAKPMADRSTTMAPTVLTVPLTEGECPEGSFLCISRALAKGDPLSANEIPSYLTKVHVRGIRSEFAAMYKSTAHFFLPLPLLKDEEGGAMQQNRFCTRLASEKGSAPSNLSCSIHVVATGMYKFMEADANQSKTYAHQIDREMEDEYSESVKVVTVSTVDEDEVSKDVSAVTTTSPLVRGYSFCKNVYLSSVFWRIEPEKETVLDVASLNSDDRDSTTIYILWLSTLYTFLMSFIIGRCVKMRCRGIK